jgi:hypothetical protein|tara:strand:+ start:666 stop:1505 length:840 start_codon:yes stop_codon:yes gene_type:complete
MQVKEIPFEPSTIETIDTGLYNWVKKTLALHTTTNEGWKKVPVIWLGAERSFQVKKDQLLRDSDSRLKLPVISVNRESITKDPSFKGSFQAHYSENNDYKGGTVTITRRIQQEKTRNFTNADIARILKDSRTTGPQINNKGKTVYQEITIPVPSYVEMMYNITLRTEYQQQMNDLVAPFISKTGGINGFIIEQEGYTYEGFIQPAFTETKNIKDLGEDERMFETNVSIKVLGYLIGEGKNRERPKVTIRENIVKIRISRERVLIGDKIPWKEKDNDYIE